jgi:mannosyltransferase OCH1-like enzyme
MAIPRIVHQLWKTETIPARWQAAVDSVKRYHRGWEYRLWTDERMDEHVRKTHPALYPIFAGFERNIMRADVFRYVLMHDLGGLYCDLDYEFVRPFEYGDADVVLSLEYDQVYGDDVDQIANYVFASVPRHDLWRDVLADVQSNPPFAANTPEVCTVTGPGLLTRVFFAGRQRYSGIQLTHKPVLSPRRVHGRREQKFYVNSGITYGFHHGWGSWKERLTRVYLKQKWARLLRFSRR